MAATFSNPIVEPMGYILGEIASIKSEDERDWLLSNLATAAEYYFRGREAGYKEGLRESKEGKK